MDFTSPGERLPKNHRLVLDILTEHGTGTHLTMAELHRLAAERRPSIGFTTVYRALARLRDLQLVSEISLPGADSVVYEPSGPPHAHARCTGCGQVRDVPYSLPPAVAAELASSSSFEVRRVDVSLHGLCGACRTP